MLTIMKSFINPHDFVWVQVSNLTIAYQNRITRTEWFFNLKYSKLNYTVTRIDPSRYQKARLINDDERKLSCSFVHSNFFLKSAVYIAEFDNAYLSPQPAIGDTRIRVFFEEDPKQLIQRITVGSYDIGVYYTQIIGQWGHLIHDFFCAIMHVPQEVYDKGFYICTNPSGYGMITEYLKYFKMDKNINVLNIDLKTQQVFVNKLYILSSLHFAHGYTVGGIIKLRKLIFKIFKLEGIKPYKYSIINRPGLSRKIHNIKELLAALSQECPPKSEKWQIEQWDFNDIGKTVKIWSTIKVVCHPSGSGYYNSIFMQENTGYLAMMSKQKDFPNFHLAAISNMYIVGITHTNMEHYFSQPIPCDVPRMVAGCKVLFELMEKGTCNDTRFQIPINIEEAKSIPDIEIDELSTILNRTVL
ncbi:hypothetical protein TVAG_486690 [Trichomonas vaginalis G3]|uniref:Glycosyltransferase 61 catalytic domain-containing protein n=1 Tax=Trichomonas vaginalis (strain ATCC PRA-98 / G3) TaxID=412133 RepID=A2DZ97_TRIV3|nr:glycosyltransferase family [Trichomonas vaginalis G3]EAY14226.1 hypothetical protein TVAG_486690 [Trichomonas vaginalis G3]KAI5491834.1 glycosyltransferase family [Trichomonas vaginalis G3]|eukprot:XP_001326449.1 hypothetical protein [Trichomonas vaginalis G3]